MSISTPFIRRPIGTSLLIAAMVLVGIAAYPLLPVAPLPRVDFPTIQVSGQFPGASPDTMASAVAANVVLGLSDSLDQLDAEHYYRCCYYYSLCGLCR